MKHWNLYPTISAAMPFQMALDEVLFRDYEVKAGPGEPPLFRFFYSSGPWITTGYSEKELGAEKNGVPVCRRLTGGGQVFHGDDIIFALIAKKDADESFDSVRMSYLKIHEAVKMAFEDLGLKPRFYRVDEKLPKGPECFAFPIATDLAVGSKKVAGGSQKRSRGTFLHEESIYLQGYNSTASLMGALKSAFEKRFEIKLKDCPISPETLASAELLAKEKYEPKG